MNGRRLNIVDISILVFALGLGLGAARIYQFLAPPYDWWSEVVISTVYSLLLAASLALLIIRLRSPRPRLSHLFCQPGFVACFTAVFLAGWAFLNLGLSLLVTYGISRWTDEQTINMLLNTIIYSKPHSSIILVWLILALSRRWRPERTWIDRLGIAIGILYILVTESLWPLEYFGVI